MGSSFEALNLSKLSVAYDLTNAESMRKFKKLLAGADVLLTNTRVQSLERLGLSPETVCHCD